MDFRLSGGMKRSEARGTATVLAEHAPQAMREYLAPHAERYCQRLLETLEHPEMPAYRTALDLYPKIMGAVGAQNDLLVAMLQRLQVGSVEEADREIQLSRKASGVTLEDAESRALDLLKAIMAHAPERRAVIRRELFGDMDATVAKNGHAHTNGHGGR